MWRPSCTLESLLLEFISLTELVICGPVFIVAESSGETIILIFGFSLALAGS